MDNLGDLQTVMESELSECPDSISKRLACREMEDGLAYGLSRNVSFFYVFICSKLVAMYQGHKCV